MAQEANKDTKQPEVGKKTFIGKAALVLVVTGQTESATQILSYDHFREIRADLEKLEVKVLMNYDESYFRVFAIIKPTKDDEIIKAKEQISNFYNDLINAAMKITPEEVEVLSSSQTPKKS